MDKQKCCICGKEFVGYGNNPEPLMDFDEGRCCDDCNHNYVIQYRMIAKMMISEARSAV